MCGIAGLLTAAGETPQPDVIQRMVAAIRHRGPDGSGSHIEAGVGLGHARLSIIDLGGGAQPIHNEDRTVWITYNGEVFNYVELRRFLEQRGLAASTPAPTPKSSCTCTRSWVSASWRN